MSQSKGTITQMRGEVWLAALEALCRRHLHRGMTMVEIGCFGGESTAIFARHAGSVVAVDPWHESYETDSLMGCAAGAVRDYVLSAGIAPMSKIETLFDERVADFTNVRKLKAFDQDVVASFDDDSIDLLYIDSIHTYESVKATAARWRGKVRPGGIVAGHDYSPEHWPGVVQAVREVFGGPNEVYLDTSWVVLDARARFRVG